MSSCSIKVSKLSFKGKFRNEKVYETEYMYLFILDSHCIIDRFNVLFRCFPFK